MSPECSCFEIGDRQRRLSYQCGIQIIIEQDILHVHKANIFHLHEGRFSNLQNQNFLFGVPFKLSSDVISIASDTSINIVHANQFLSYITQLNMETFDYGFQVEKSVILEGE